MKKEVSYKNDVYFKYALTRGKDAKQIREFIIEYLTGIKPKESNVVNPEFDPLLLGGKKIILDVHIVDVSGKEYDIEMQTTGSCESELKRFVYYEGRMIYEQIGEGEHYENLKGIYQIIFIDASIQTNHKLINRYQMRNEDGEPESREPLVNRIFVSLNEVQKVVQEKGGILKMDEFEQMCYLFKYNESHDIIKSKKRLVMKLMEKYRKMQNEGSIWSMAKAREIGEIRAVNLMNDKFNEGHEVGVKEGIKEGKLEGLRDSAWKLISTKYQEDSTTWLATLQVQQLEKISSLIFEYATLNDLKEAIEKTC